MRGEEKVEWREERRITGCKQIKQARNGEGGKRKEGNAEGR